MRLRKKVHKPSYAVNFAPLIDVVFLLIIFFMVVSQFTRVELEALTLPEAEKPEELGVLEHRPLIINLPPDGRVMVSGVELVPLELVEKFREELEARPDKVLEILIRADKTTPWRHVRRVLDICGKNGFDHVRVAVLKTGEQDD